MEHKIDTIKEKSKSYLSFMIGKEVFATHVAFVNNIIEVPKISEMPNTPDYFKGVINIRGNVLPVIDTRVKFQMPPTQFTSNTCILVLEIEYNHEIIPVGALVDNVQEVIEIDKQDILPPPKMTGLESVNEFIHGIINLEDKIVILLNINKLFDNEYLSNISEKVQNKKSEIN